MIKLYNYDEYTLQYKRTLEFHKIPDNYQFCSLTEIPNYNIENEYLEYVKESDSWIIKQIEKPVISLALLKENKEKEIKDKFKQIVAVKFGELRNQLNLLHGVNGFTNEDKNNYLNFINNMITQEDAFFATLNAIQTIEDFNNFNYKFIEE